MGLSFAIAAAQAPALRVLADRVELGLDYELHAVGLRHRACAKLAEKRVTSRVGSGRAGWSASITAVASTRPPPRIATPPATGCDSLAKRHIEPKTRNATIPATTTSGAASRGSFLSSAPSRPMPATSASANTATAEGSRDRT